MKFEVQIEGTRPLLQHKFQEGAFEAESKTKVRIGSHKSDDPKDSLYILASGEIYQPAEHILQSMVKASTNFKIGGKGKKTYKDIIASSIFITPEAIVHENQTWTPDKRSVVIPATRGRQMRIRPRFDKWSLTFNLLCTEEQVEPEALKQILDYAGSKVGIGDYRPRFGGFMVTQFKEVE
jgi:hypothetical protein